MKKIKVWIKNHKIWSGIIAFVLISCIVGPFINDPQSNETEEPKKKTESQKNTSNDSDNNKESKHKKTNNSAKKKSKKLTAKQKLNKNLKKEVGSDSIKSIQFSNNPDLPNVIVELKGKDNLTEKMTVRGFKMDTANALYALKKSNLDLDNADIYVYYPMNDGIKDKEEMVLSTRWDKETINEMNKDAEQTLPDNLEYKAESMFMNPSFRKYDK